MVHHVYDEEPLIPSCIISTTNFQSFLKDKKIVPLADMLRHVENGAYALTFDDSLDDLYSYVYPYLKSKGIPFTAFVSASLIDQPGYVTTAQLRQMAADSLVTIGSHGCTHQHLTTLAANESRAEIFDSKAVLEKIIQKPVDYIAYPFGDANEREYSLARRAGYKFGFDVRPRRYTVLSKLFSRMKLPRINLTNETFIKEKK